MTHTFSAPQKRLIQKLLKAGRWNSESEIIRHGLQLVASEVKRQPAPSLEPYPAGLLTRAYRRRTPRDREEEAALAQASAGPQKGELE